MDDPLDFAGDDRGVSEVVGFILVFAILVILLSINQAQIVPAENSEIEFQHFQEVRNDLVEVRSSISTAGQNDVSQFPTVRLGTDYPPRIFAVNPPPATGTLQTSEAYNITITDEDGNTERIQTRFLEYQPSYREFESGSTWYDNSVLYLDESERGGIVIIEGQNLITDNNTVRITALQNDFRQSGTRRVTVELYPTTAGNLSDLTGELNITIPTQLSGGEYWDDAFESGVPFNPTVTTDWYESGVHALNLTVEKEDLKINTVGIQEEPEGRTAKENVGSSGTDSQPSPSEQTNLVNTGNTQTGDGHSTIEFGLKNEGSSPVTITGIAVNSTSADSNEIDNNGDGEFVGAGGYWNGTSSIIIGSPAYTLDKNAVIAGGATSTFTLGEFQKTSGNAGENMKDEVVNLTLYFDDGNSKEFVLSIPN